MYVRNVTVYYTVVPKLPFSHFPLLTSLSYWRFICCRELKTPGRKGGNGLRDGHPVLLYHQCVLGNFANELVYAVISTQTEKKNARTFVDSSSLIIEH